MLFSEFFYILKIVEKEGCNLSGNFERIEEEKEREKRKEFFDKNKSANFKNCLNV